MPLESIHQNAAPSIHGHTGYVLLHGVSGMAEKSLYYPNNYKHTIWTFILLTLPQRMAQSIQTHDNQINYTYLFYASLKLQTETCRKLIEVHKTCRIAHSYLTSGQYKQANKQTQTNNCKQINKCCSKFTFHSLTHLVSFYRPSTTYSCFLARFWPLCI